MSNNHRFAGLPLVLVAATILFIALLHPTWLQQLQLYANSNGENLPFSAFWYLDWLLLPAIGTIFAVRTWTGFFSKVIQIAIGLLLPLVLFLSYWMWEALGWLLMVGYASALGVAWYNLSDNIDNEHSYTQINGVIQASMIVIYTVARIVFYFVNDSALPYLDITLVAALSLLHIIDALIAWWYTPDGIPAFSNSIYLLLFAGLMYGATYINAPKLKDMPAIDAPTATTTETKAPQKTEKKEAKKETKKAETKQEKRENKATETPTTKSAQPATEKTKTAANNTPATKTQEQPVATTPKQEQPTAPVEKKVHPVEGYKTAAAAGDAAAMYNLAKCYQQGDGVAKNTQEAFRHMKAAAEAGYTKAYCELADMYRGGRGVAKSREQAELWYRKAAAAGDRKAQQALDNM